MSGSSYSCRRCDAVKSPPQILSRDKSARGQNSYQGEKRPGNGLQRSEATPAIPGAGATPPRLSTPFQRRVWDYLVTIPAGETRSYAEVAAALGCPRATRAVANACAANTEPVTIPCHRVIRADGTLGGYRWGVARKRALLRAEGALP
jgi:O-6-methylguanine DNA methyltransferase